MSGALRVLIVTNLYPNNADPGFAPFNRQQFKELGKLAEVEVWAVIPWRFGRSTSRSSTSDVVKKEWIDQLPVSHPRFLSIPGVPSLNATLLTGAVVPELLLRKKKRTAPDVILAAYAYPEGVAGVAAGRAIGVPVVVKCHGSDLNRVPSDAAARFQITRFLPRADRVITVSQKLGDRARELGVPGEKIRVVYNGIDRDRFKHADRDDARRRLRLPVDREIVLYVGHLAEHKGAKDLMRATEMIAARRPKAMVVFVGDGPLLPELQRTAEGLASTGALLATGHIPHEEVADYLAAADLLCLPSWDEGMPNVVREAHASGRPVVATSVGGIPEAVFREELGRLVAPKQPAALADALIAQLDAPRVPAARITELAVVPTWAESAAQVLEVLQEARAGRSP